MEENWAQSLMYIPKFHVLLGGGYISSFVQPEMWLKYRKGCGFGALQGLSLNSSNIFGY
jgi:hypothetical protein